MSKVVRISDEAYEQLMALTSGPETIGEVIEALIVEHGRAVAEEVASGASRSFLRLPSFEPRGWYDGRSGAVDFSRPWRVERSNDGSLSAEFLGRWLLLTLGAFPSFAGTTREVLAKMHDTLSADGLLTPVDEVLNQGDRNRWPRWESSVRFRRQRFVSVGLLRADSKAGVWALSRAGENAVAALKQSFNG